MDRTEHSLYNTPPIHPFTREFYEKYLTGEGVEGPNLSCEYYPCHHMDNQNCTFCYCPFYPCGDSSTGGRCIKEKKVWDCKECNWVHQDDVVECVQNKLNTLLKKVEDLQGKRKELLELRNECLDVTIKGEK